MHACVHVCVHCVYVQMYILVCIVQYIIVIYYQLKCGVTCFKGKHISEWTV